ncbi:MAG: trypsin-like peptidase domain-containing protein [Deltaproteobacteria bacterium]|nr:trypsin-like peptidase domain-containing protein [Deltaproteobacteria bacterium]
MRPRFTIIMLSLALILAVTAGTWQPGPAPVYGSTATGLQADFTRVAQSVMPSVVSLKAIKVVTMQPPPGAEDFFRGTPFEGTFREFGSRPIRRRQVGQGSGVIIDPRGFILTNNHVVAGSQQILVHLYDGRELQGRVIGTDPRFDVALVQVQAQGLRAAPLGDSGRLQVGQWAIAIGSPYGLEQTMTVGIISATGRKGLGRGNYGDFIQTDASINPGNSGGPLLDIDGRVIGINSMIAAQAQGIGFAIPINTARQIISRWIR